MDPSIPQIIHYSHTANLSTGPRYLRASGNWNGLVWATTSNGVAGDKIHIVITPTGANRNITFNASYQFLENNDAPTELELGFTYDFVITKTDSRFIIS